MIKAAIIGATGYAGIELVRLLSQHPAVKILHAFTDSYAGKDIIEIYPHLRHHSLDINLKKFDLSIIKDCDLIFISLPHGLAADIVPGLIAAGKRVIDLGADFRLKSPAQYLQYYQKACAQEDLLNLAVYGLPEMGAGVRESIRTARLVANPGCYPTACILASLPALASGFIDPNDCIFDAKSGISGAGRSLSLHTHFCEVADNLSPYQVGGIHRHTPEIEQALSAISGKQVSILFTPHLVPLVRGLVVTAYFKLTAPLNLSEIIQVYQKTYQDENFIRINSPSQMTQVKNVLRSNYCDLSIVLDKNNQRLIVISAIDNLIKGAAGQAIQNMNLMYELPETFGLLNHVASYP